MATKIGFSGTQRGMTIDQHNKFHDLMNWYEDVFGVDEFHHGDCIGADSDAHYIVDKHFDNTLIVVHPPSNSSKRAFCKGDKILKPKDYLDRNHDIVDSTDILIVTPKELKEELRSGTWATVRYAKKQGKKIRIIWPDGTIDEITGR